MTLHGCTLRALTVFGALMLGQPGVSAQPQTAALSLEDFSDRLTKDVPVSGRMLVGVAGVTAKGKMPLGLPAPRVLWRGTEKEVPKEPLCVSFASRDGQYFGEGRVRVADLVKQTTPFPVTAKPNPEAKKVVDLQPFDDFAVLVSSGDCRLGATSDKTKVHVIDYETDLRAPGPRTLAIAINSMTYTISVAASEGSWSGQAVCKPLLEAQRNKAFNTICELAVPSELAKANLVISRRRYERVFPPLEFTLAW